MASSYKSRYNSRSSIKSSKTPTSSESSSGIWLVLGLLVLLIIIVIIVGGFYKRFENFTNKKNYTLKYFYMKSCKFCNDFNPIWDDLIKDINVDTVKYDISENAEGIKQAELYKVKGAPTIILADNNNEKNSIEYEGNRTVADIKDFINKNTN